MGGVLTLCPNYRFVDKNKVIRVRNNFKLKKGNESLGLRYYFFKTVKRLALDPFHPLSIEINSLVMQSFLHVTQM